MSGICIGVYVYMYRDFDAVGMYLALEYMYRLLNLRMENSLSMSQRVIFRYWQGTTKHTVVSPRGVIAKIILG